MSSLFKGLSKNNNCRFESIITILAMYNINLKFIDSKYDYYRFPIPSGKNPRRNFIQSVFLNDERSRSENKISVVVRKCHVKQDRFPHVGCRNSVKALRYNITICLCKDTLCNTGNMIRISKLQTTTVIVLSIILLLSIK